jgi:hypothetical protein
MRVITWNNGSHHLDGNGYGIKISALDRDQFFDPQWKTIFLELDGKHDPVEINVRKKSFWNKTCRELISKEIGMWLIEHDLHIWQPGQPVQLELQITGERKFRLTIPN